MIPARKTRWFARWFSGHAQRRIERTFGRVLVSGLGPARELCRSHAVVLVLNHTTWWDALVAVWLSERVLAVDGHAIMNADNLRRLPFFARVGAIGVDLDDVADGARAIRYGARLLDRPGRALFVFPEGRERSPFAPLELRPGAAQIARVASDVLVVPVGLRYVFGEAEAPDLFVSFGAALRPHRDVDEGVREQTLGIARALAVIDGAVLSRSDAGFDVVHRRSAGLLARFAERLLVRLLPG